MKNLFRVEIRTCEIKVEFRKDREERRRFPKKIVCPLYSFCYRKTYIHRTVITVSTENRVVATELPK